MTAEHRAIVQAYESEGMMPDDIANDRDLDVTAVKASLMQNSSKYRKDCGLEVATESKLNFSEDEQERIKDMLVSLALGGESEKVRLTAAMYVRDDAKGRKDVVKGISAQQNNIFLINEQLQKVRGIADRVKSSMSMPMKEITTNG